MAIIRVTPYKNNNSKSLAFGKWFMRTFLNSVLDINDLANHMANDSKIERTMVANINSAITRQIVELLCNGHPIRIPHFGLLKLGVNSKGESTVSDFNAGSDIKNVHLLLQIDEELKQELSKIKFEKVYYEMKSAGE